MDVTVTIDGRKVTVTQGTTILKAAKKVGKEIPVLCSLEGYEPFTSCMVCVVRDKTSGKLVPSCSVAVEQGMDIDTKSDVVYKARQEALNMLLGEHVGECFAPCTRTCPAHPDLPGMIRHIQHESDLAALAVIREAIPFPGITGHICPAPCEKVCRRGSVDAPLSLKLLERYAGSRDWSPEQLPGRTGKRVAVIGGGPAGLAAAYTMCLKGHDCTLFEKEKTLGGEVRKRIPPERLPREILDRELSVLITMGVKIKTGTALGTDVSLEEIQADYNAVILTLGSFPEIPSYLPECLIRGNSIHVTRGTYQTSLPGVFAGGGCVRHMSMAIRAMTTGKQAASMADRFLRELLVNKDKKAFQSTVATYTRGELLEFLNNASRQDRLMPSGGESSGFTGEESRKEAARCLHCDCYKISECLLKKYSEEYNGDQHRYKRETRRQIRRITDHPLIIYEPSKCIKCGRCVRITENKEHGFCFNGRGYKVDITIPFNGSLHQLDDRTAVLCAQICPTGAIALKERKTCK
jgi:ferredoxin